MFSPHFFIGTGYLRFWYLAFYLLSLPLYLLGLLLLASLPINTAPDARDVVLTILSFGYLLLGLFSLIHTIIYTRKTKRYISGFSILFGSQILFWMIGGFLGNHYRLLAIYFLIFLLYALFMNLSALALFQPIKKEKERKKKN